MIYFLEYTMQNCGYISSFLLSVFTISPCLPVLLFFIQNLLLGEEVVIEGEQERAIRAQEGVVLLNNLCATYGLDKQVRYYRRSIRTWFFFLYISLPSSNLPSDLSLNFCHPHFSPFLSLSLSACMFVSLFAFLSFFLHPSIHPFICLFLLFLCLFQFFSLSFSCELHRREKL